ncbi:hypothetical protein [Candidatus Tisiphia endosymbiont of Hybos culiciformis]|uniref:hypothetical protein n=1 Tax=Candidatus Tisiphia endosymbiont of Hybos culiciformis TaxID=3139331 RepID=UPI003CCA92C4
MPIGLGDKEHNDCKMSFPRRRESIVMLIGLGDKEHNDCKLSFPRRRESRYLLSQG